MFSLGIADNLCFGGHNSTENVSVETLLCYSHRSSLKAKLRRLAPTPDPTSYLILFNRQVFLFTSDTTQAASCE